MITMNYIASFFLIFLGLYCIVVKHNAVKTVIGMCVMDYGVNIFLISVGYVPGGTSPMKASSTAIRTAPSAETSMSPVMRSRRSSPA